MKKILSVVFALIVVAGLMSMSVFAADDPAAIGAQGYATLAAAISAAGDGETITLADGTHTMPDSVAGKNITIEGGRNAVIEQPAGGVTASDSTLTFDGVTLQFGHAAYQGFKHATEVVYNDCALNGRQTLYAHTVTFTDCVLTHDDSTSVWTYGATNVTFTGCTFQSGGRAVQLYNESTDPDFVANVSFTDCTFNSDGSDSNKTEALVWSNRVANSDNKYNLTFTNCTANITNDDGRKLWGNSDNMDSESVQVTVDNVLVYPIYVAKIGDKSYADLADAFAYAKANSGSTITLLDDVDLSEWTSVNMDAVGFTLDGNNKTITGLPCALIDSITTGGNTVVIKNLTISGAVNAGMQSNHSGVVNAGGLVNVVGYINATISNVHVVNSTVGTSSTYYAGGLIGYVAATNESVLNIDGCSVTNTTVSSTSSAGGLFGHSNGGLTTVTDTEVGNNTVTGGSEAKAGSLIGTLTACAGTKIDVTETAQSSGTGTLNVIGRAYTGVTYTGGSYYTDPTVASDTNDNTDIALAEDFIVNTEGGKYSVEEDVVAKIGNTEYPSIVKAVNALRDGDTLTILKSIDSEIVIAKALKNVTITAAEGVTVSGILFDTKTDAPGTGREFENITVTGIDFVQNGVRFNCGGTPWTVVKGFTMTDCSFVGTKTDATVGNRLFDIGIDSPGSNQFHDITITNCTVDGCVQGIRLGALYGDCTISNNTINNAYHNSITLRSIVTATVVVENNTITNGGDRAFRIGTQSDAATVSYISNTIVNTGDDDGSNFKTNATTAFPYVFADNTVDGEPWMPGVAQVGNSGYFVLANALAAAGRGDTVVLLADVTERGITVEADDKIILDLAGFTLTGDILSEGDLTVKNGAIISDTFVSAIESYGENAALTLENVNVASQRHALRIEGGTAVIHSGSFTAIGRVGEVETVHALNAGGKFATAVTIYGGTFNGIKFGNNAEQPDSGAAVNAQKNASVTICGGNFAYGQNETLRATDGGTITITGGTYDQDPTVYVVGDNWVQQTAADSYTVLPMGVPAITITADTDTLEGEGTVILTVTGVPAGETVTVTCDVYGITVTDNKDGTYTVQLPDATREYVFTVSFAGNEEYKPATASCTVNAEKNPFDWQTFAFIMMMMQKQEYKIDAAATEGGTITPAGITAVKYGKSQTYVITPAAGYTLVAVIVDGKDVGAVTAYTFSNIKDNHTVSAVFQKTATQNPFKDVSEKDWFYEDVLFVSQMGLMIGVSETLDTFAPDQTLNRATLIVTLWRLTGAPVVSLEDDFTDLGNDWYTAAMKWAIKEELIRGYGDGTCRPLSEITHEEVCAILRRYAELRGEDVTASDITLSSAHSDWAEADVQWATASGLLAGFGSDMSDLTATAIRGEIAAYLTRLCKLLAL